MSRAFVKENDLEHAGIDVPERPISSEKNYVTPDGLMELEEKISNLEEERTKSALITDSIHKQKKLQLERDLRYFINRLESAILVSPKEQDKNKVLFVPGNIPTVWYGAGAVRELDQNPDLYCDNDEFTGQTT